SEVGVVASKLEVLKLLLIDQHGYQVKIIHLPPVLMLRCRATEQIWERNWLGLGLLWLIKPTTRYAVVDALHTSRNLVQNKVLKDTSIDKTLKKIRDELLEGKGFSVKFNTLESIQVHLIQTGLPFKKGVLKVFAQYQKGSNKMSTNFQESDEDCDRFEA
ncbi:hypothetical protein SO802_011562, partial [Lithocarpus litseifolius]